MLKTQFFPDRLSSAELPDEDVDKLAEILDKVYGLYLKKKIDVLIFKGGTVTFTANRILIEFFNEKKV